MTLLLCFFLLVVSAQADGFYQDHTRGWHWYETLPIPEEKKPEDKEADSSKHQSPTAFVKAYREELESRLHKAWLKPTLDNIRSYQEMQKDMMERSKIFSLSWMKSIYENPALDHTLVSPVNQQARHIQIDQEKHRTQETIRDLSQDYGLFFFFSSNCPYCHQFAPIVKRFAETHGWEVIAISTDGGSIEAFPDAEADNGLSQIWNIKALPALFAVNPRTKAAIPIAYGLTSQDEMENRIMALIGGKS